MEILVVVVILGILAAIVIPAVSASREESRQTVFVTNLRTFAEAAQLYTVATGEYLEDSSSGQFPRWWGDYARQEEWTGGTSIGGVWDCEKDSFGVKSALGVHFYGTVNPPTRDDTYMTRVDTLVDDGALDAGGFRKIADDRYYLILAE